MTRDKTENMSLNFGVFLICAGILFNKWFINLLRVEFGNIPFIEDIAIWLIQLALISTGILLLTKPKFAGAITHRIDNLLRCIHDRIRSISPSSFILFVSLVIGMMLTLEISVRYYLENYAEKYRLTAYGTYNMIKDYDMSYIRHPYLGYCLKPNITNESGDKHNSIGLRGEEIQTPKPDSTFRILCIGGSTTYGTHVPNYKKAYPYILQKELEKAGYRNIEVINGGVGNADSWYSLINLEFRTIYLEPDLVIIYHGDNDIESRMVYPTQAYLSDNTGRFIPHKVIELGFVERSVVLRILKKLLLSRLETYGSLESLFNAPTYVQQEYVVQLIRGEYPAGIFREIDVIDILGSNPPVYSERNYKNIISICRSESIEIILSTYSFSPISVETDTELYRIAVDEHNAMIKKVAIDKNVAIFDFKALMPLDSLYWKEDGIHLNEKGNELKGRLFADFISGSIELEDGSYQYRYEKE